MNSKADHKEKFTVITIEEKHVPIAMANELNKTLLAYISLDVPHIVLNLQLVEEIDNEAGFVLAELQQNFYENDCSFVICSLQKKVEEKLNELEILEVMNVTPTESEAWDIVQMEEIERELFNDEEGS